MSLIWWNEIAFYSFPFLITCFATQLEIAKELDRLSAKLDDVDEMISSTMATDPQVQSLLSSTADVWMPVITANSEERRKFTASPGDNNTQTDAENSK